MFLFILLVLLCGVGRCCGSPRWPGGWPGAASATGLPPPRCRGGRRRRTTSRRAAPRTMPVGAPPEGAARPDDASERAARRRRRSRRRRSPCPSPSPSGRPRGVEVEAPTAAPEARARRKRPLPLRDRRRATRKSLVDDDILDEARLLPLEGGREAAHQAEVQRLVEILKPSNGWRFRTRRCPITMDPASTRASPLGVLD